MTTVQKVTAGLIVAYVIWEIYVRVWEKTENPAGATIRVDLMLIYPVLAILVIISLYQYFKK